MRNYSKCNTSKTYFDNCSKSAINFDYNCSEYVKLDIFESSNIKSNIFPQAQFDFSHSTADIYQVGQAAKTGNRLLTKIGADKNLFVGDCIIAGGCFTEYVSQSPFAIAFPHLFEDFQFSRDTNVFINSSLRYTPQASIETHSSRRGHVNIIHTSFNIAPTSTFDFHFCKIWRGCNIESDKNRSYIQDLTFHKSLISNNNKFTTYDYNMYPSFIHADKLLASRIQSGCICMRYLRVLKAAFKGFYNSSDLLEEIKFAKIFFQNNSCKICEMSFYSTHS